MRPRHGDDEDFVTLQNRWLSATVHPRRGASIVSIVERGSGTELLWRPRWGMRPRDVPDLPGSSEAVSMGHYSGGWSTLFPNAGGASLEHGVEWPMHGEVWLAPFDVERRGKELVCRTHLVRSPFVFTRVIRLEGNSLSVIEHVTNVGGEPLEYIWNSHPAFGAPLVDPDAVIRTNATRVYPDVADDRVADPEAFEPWPRHRPPGGSAATLHVLPEPASSVSRRAFLARFRDPEARVEVVNRRLGIAAQLSWRAEEFPFAWYWMEAGGRAGFPWYSAAYVLGIEPCTSYPTGGLSVVRQTTGTQHGIPPGASASKTVTLTVRAGRTVMRMSSIV